jgi:hypothetical protein
VARRRRSFSHENLESSDSSAGPLFGPASTGMD